MRVVVAAVFVLGMYAGAALCAEPGLVPGPEERIPGARNGELQGDVPSPDASAVGPQGEVASPDTGARGPQGEVAPPPASPGEPQEGPAAPDLKDFKFGKSESELLKSFRGLVCADAQSNIWGQADRSCFMAGEVMPHVRGTLVLNLRNDRFVSVALVVDKLEVDRFLHELVRRHGKPSAALPSMEEPQKVIWLYENRVLILERSLDELPNMSSLLVSADEPVIERARSLVTQLGGHVPPHRNLSSE